VSRSEPSRVCGRRTAETIPAMTEIFPNAPITEALIDVRTVLPKDVSLAELEALHESVKDGYPEKQTRTLWQSSFELKDATAPQAKTSSQKLGYLFKSADGKQAVQFRLDGFSFSRFRPYTNWDQVYQEAKQLWEIYRSGTNPVQVSRLATRYINSIEIPHKAFDYDDYLTSAPRVPPNLPPLLVHFFTRLVVPFPAEGATAFIVQTPLEKADPVNSTLILDIDVFKEVALLPGDAKIDEIFAILRAVKNAIFFNSVTEKAKELFR
jgi:uncharacterized protein (TIGR04255 family)